MLYHFMSEDWNVNGMALLTSFCIHINIGWIMCGFTCMLLIEWVNLFHVYYINAGPSDIQASGIPIQSSKILKKV